MLYHAHPVLVQREIHKVLLGIFKKLVCVDDRKQPDDLLNEVSGVRMAGQLEEVLSYTFAH